MNLHNNYYWFSEAIPKEACQKIIDLGLETLAKNKEDGIDTKGTTAGNTHKGGLSSLNAPMDDKTLEEIAVDENIPQDQITTQKYIRDSEVAWLREQWLYDLILPLVYEANEKAGWKFELSGAEAFQFTVYHPGGFYGWHTDSGSDHHAKYKRYIPGVSKVDENGQKLKGYVEDPVLIGKVRKISLTINLNPTGEYEGGNLKFDFGPHSPSGRYHECIEIRPQGSVIVFPSFINHQVTPLTKGTRYSLVLWNLGYPFK